MEISEEITRQISTEVRLTRHLKIKKHQHGATQRINRHAGKLVPSSTIRLLIDVREGLKAVQI
jgi:hypothetical protein